MLVVFFDGLMIFLEPGFLLPGFNQFLQGLLKSGEKFNVKSLAFLSKPPFTLSFLLSLVPERRKG